MSSRGPDYSHFERTEDVILGHNRLAIIDLDSRSNQPFSYLHVSIVFNGEVYNYKDIRSHLRIKGFQFQTDSDTEVICAAYLEYGSECLRYFNGMFSFVIYDSRKKVLFGARDRLGKKPFYYSHTNKSEFEFSSQASSIHIGRKLTVSQQSLNRYLVWGYVPEPESIWGEVKKLPAGHQFTFDLIHHNLHISKYWDLEAIQTFHGGYEEAKNELSNLLHDAVKIRMNAHVPLGVFLSGGVDSSLIAALAVKMTGNVKTFSVKFREEEVDESRYATMVAQHLGTEHHTIECNYTEGIDLIKRFAVYYDEPFADSSAIPSMLLSKYTKSEVTVALTGDGGDEGFMGYQRYNWMNKANMLFKLPAFFRKSMARLLSVSPNYRHKLISLGLSSRDIKTLYMKFMGGMDHSYVLQPDPAYENDFMSIWLDPKRSFSEQMSDFDIKTYLNGDINTKVDRATMAFSLESRAPLMDYRVIELARSFPVAFKYSATVQKRILKDVLYQHVPEKFFARPKAGFTMPFKEWFRTELKEYVMDNLSEKNLKDIPGIDVRRAMEMIDEHMSFKWNRYPQIWRLLVLNQWLSTHARS